MIPFDGLPHYDNILSLCLSSVITKYYNHIIPHEDNEIADMTTSFSYFSVSWLWWNIKWNRISESLYVSLILFNLDIAFVSLFNMLH